MINTLNEVVATTATTPIVEPKFKLERTNKDGTWPISWQFLTDGKENEIQVYESPFHNCQIYTIGSFEQLVFGFTTRDYLKKALEQIQYTVGKSRLVIDVQNDTQLHEAIEKIFTSDYIVFRQDYINNTGSEMTMYMLKTIPIGF